MFSVVIYLVGLVFSAGVAWSRAGAVKKDVNGLGARLKIVERESNDRLKIVERESNDRFRRVCMAALVLAKTEEEKKLIVETLGAVE